MFTIKIVKIAILSILMLSANLLIAQSARTPGEKIPPEMLMDLKILDVKFQGVLLDECPNGQCIYRGCVYQRHEVVTMKSNRRLPGITIDNSVASDNTPQYFLSRARCEYAYEPSLRDATVKDLNSRLQAKLSKGMLRVTIKSVKLPPVPEALAIKSSTVGEGLLHGFLRDHIAPLVFLTIGSLIIFALIWSYRRLGKDSLEDQLRFMQFKKGIENQKEPAELKDETSAEKEIRAKELVDYFKSLPNKLQPITKRWLDIEAYEKLAYASQIFAKTGAELLPNKSGMLQKKIKLQKYMQEEFFYEEAESLKVLEEMERAIGAVDCLFDQRTEIFHQFYTSCHPRGIAKIIDETHPGIGAAIITLAPTTEQKAVIEHCSESTVVKLAHRLLSSPFISDTELEMAEETIIDAKAGKETKRRTPENQYDYGTRMEVTQPLSLLLAKLTPKQRQKAWGDAKLTNAGRVPSWTEGVFYDDIMCRLDDTQLRSLFLECDASRLAPWFSNGVDPELKERIISVLPESYGKVLKTPIFQEGRHDSREAELGKALVKLCGRGDISFDKVF